MKRPASQWYWADHLRDPGVRAASLAARGLWTDMLALMHEGEPYGHLTVGGVAMTDTQLARIVGESAGKVKKLIAELERFKVFSRTDDGVIYSRRQVRDEHIRTIRAESGKLGGNPNLDPPPKDNAKDKDLVNQKDKEKQTPSSSSSASTSASPSKQLPNSNSAREALAARLPAEYADDLDGFLTGLGAEHRQLAWIKNLEAVLDGAGDVATTPKAVGAAIRQLVGNGERPNWNLFRGYLRNEGRQPLNGKAPANGSTTRAMRLVGLIRERRNPLYPNSVVENWQTGLSDADIQVCKTFGLTRILNDQNEGTMVAQLTKALEESAHA